MENRVILEPKGSPWPPGAPLPLDGQCVAHPEGGVTNTSQEGTFHLLSICPVTDSAFICRPFFIIRREEWALVICFTDQESWVQIG